MKIYIYTAIALCVIAPQISFAVMSTDEAEKFFHATLQLIEEKRRIPLTDKQLLTLDILRFEIQKALGHLDPWTRTIRHSTLPGDHVEDQRKAIEFAQKLRDIQVLRSARAVVPVIRNIAPVVVAGVGAGTAVITGTGAVAGTGLTIGVTAAAGLAVAIPVAVGGISCAIYRGGYNRAVARNQALCVSLHICRTTRHMVRNPQCSEADLLTAIQDNTAWLHYWGRALKTCIALTFGVVTPISLNTACP